MATTDDPTERRAQINRWWAGDPSEIFWLEVSARGPDLGVDLNAPLENEVGRRFWSYDIIDEVEEGEIVVHYDRDAHAILAWSIAVGSAWEDVVVWAARGTFARGQNIRPHERLGRRLSLHGPVRLAQPLSLDRIREARAELEGVSGDRPYFPFELGSRALRPLQGYLFKLPAAFLDLFPQLDEVPRSRQGPGPTLPAIDGSGTRPDFVPRNELIRSRKARPWLRDPSEIDRALASHARIERLVAEAAVEEWEPKAIGQGDPPFDLLLRNRVRDLEVVVEVKSTTAVNEEKQLRLALGQVLRYRQVLRRQGGQVHAMIAIERPPADSSWVELCRELGVFIAWPESVEDVLGRVT